MQPTDATTGWTRPVLVAVYPTTSTGSKWNSLCNVAP